ncbi:GTPase-activating protein LRG1 [Kluyveromyces lactis]|uniref:KLLA0D19877p n=1 Tax=Kluyveromyces lactis (strain ATCC 8585 / CBS 2359 / DSM 70799 / NBRC 1267 / NRRL Y-1140 / WM37) TaxID=284590 RepID=Q6CQ44_KLULA|nr:uncharacterized protein KLLA0_D19877g [Kluyveromyces lactis]CAH01041.1 KLLA0D19877p [Kluyveromyces lactis]|eukprot:XP_453945.1 uncharacterized protein KLLA0_D19877g [Kluyveromyces lactis]
MSRPTIARPHLYNGQLPNTEEVLPNRTESYMAVKSKSSPRPTRQCADCKKPIHSNALKALGSHYHENCLVCYDCGAICKPKYFPYDLPDSKETVLLCQKHYFTRNNLLCSVCKEPLSGIYFNTFGKLYDEQHFCCSLCGEKCKVDECFHHYDNLYCKYHFLKYLSRRCEGCGYPISDQYIEFQKGDKMECWHTECYGIHKYWHVTISPEDFGLPNLKVYRIEEYNAENDNHPDLKEMDCNILTFNKTLSKIWTVLYRFEEETANCVSDMFQYLTGLDQNNGLDASALLVLKVSCLLKAIDSLDTLRIYQTKLSFSANDHPGLRSDQKLKTFIKMQTKIPNKLSTKIMIYLQLLRKITSSSNSENDVDVNSFISVITGIAQFLKLLIRDSLTNALEYCKMTKSSSALLKYLREIEKNEDYQEQPFEYINITINATDSCTYCGKYIKDACIKHGIRRWHKECLRCSVCNKFIDNHELSEAAYNDKTSEVHCGRCSVDDPNSKVGFKSVSCLEQLIFLLQIALVRSKTVMKYNSDYANTSKNAIRNKSMQQTYIRTLNDVKRLKYRRTSMKVSCNKEEVRQSRVIETEERRVDQDIAGEKDLVIQTDQRNIKKQSTIFEGTKSLTLDDISRIVATEKSRELIPGTNKDFTASGDNVPTKKATNSNIYYSELTSEQYYILQIIAFSLLNSEGFDMQQIKPPDFPHKMSNNNGLWTKFKTIMGGKESKKSSYKKVFGTPLEYLTSHCGVESDLGVGPSKLKIPILVDELISSLRQLDMSVEGVFRKNGNIRRLKLLVEEIDNQPQHCPDLSKENVIQLSDLLKKFLRELPNPLLTFSLYNHWINATKLSDQKRKERALELLYTMLPRYYRNVAEVIFSFLYWASSFSHVDGHSGSKMDIHNLSTVIAPNVLYREADNVSNFQTTTQAETYVDAFANNEAEEYFIAIEAIGYLITNNEKLSMVPKYLSDLLDQAEQQQINSLEDIRNFIKNRNRTN